MREPTIAHNYADTLVALATKAGDLEGWGAMMSTVANAVEQDRSLKIFLDSPRVSAARKNEIIARAFADRMPRLFVRFLEALVTHRRQALIPEIAVEYLNIVDQMSGRVHAQVTMAREPDAALRDATTRHLATRIGKSIVPHFTVDPAILGGTIIRVGDTVMDGSVRGRLARLRSRMLAGAAR